ncbi:MAG: hypothetical protein V2I43_11130 [Parvularcula sp.]|nr:hypothetical protein [Parvularcula sp.]
MTEHSPLPPDDLAALWQSEKPQFDAAAVKRSIEHDSRLQRRINAVSLIGALFVGSFSLWLEWRGVFRFPFLLSGAILVSVLYKVYDLRRIRRRLSMVGALNAEELLRHGIARAKTSLRNGRMLYALNPLALMLGVALSPFLSRTDEPTIELGATFYVLLSLLLAAFLMGIPIGVRMARQARERMMELQRRLNELLEEA